MGLDEDDEDQPQSARVDVTSFTRGATIGRSRLPRIAQGFWVPIPCLFKSSLDPRVGKATQPNRVHATAITCHHSAAESPEIPDPRRWDAAVRILYKPLSRCSSALIAAQRSGGGKAAPMSQPELRSRWRSEPRGCGSDSAGQGSRAQRAAGSVPRLYLVKGRPFVGHPSSLGESKSGNAEDHQPECAGFWHSNSCGLKDCVFNEVRAAVLKTNRRTCR